LPSAWDCEACRLPSAAGSGAVLSLVGEFASVDDLAAEFKPFAVRSLAVACGFWFNETMPTIQRQFEIFADRALKCRLSSSLHR
jgi:hypothetical protein